MKFPLLLLCLFLLPLPLLAETKAPIIIASIKPVHSLVAAVMEGETPPLLLVEGSASPHTYQLKPSQAQALRQADIVFYVSLELEVFLEKPLGLLPASAQKIALAEQSGITLLPVRQGEGFGGHDDHEGHYKGATDWHVWLNPANAALMAGSIEEALSARFPAQSARYRANTKILKEKLRALDAELRAQMQPVQGKPFFVFHDAYRYFEDAYGLQAAGALLLHPEQGAGARHMAEMKARITKAEVTCIFREPQFDDRLISALTKGASVRVSTLDPEGASIPDGPELYFALMRGIAASVAECLG